MESVSTSRSGTDFTFIKFQNIFLKSQSCIVYPSVLFDDLWKSFQKTNPLPQKQICLALMTQLHDKRQKIQTSVVNMATKKTWIQKIDQQMEIVQKMSSEEVQVFCKNYKNLTKFFKSLLPTSKFNATISEDFGDFLRNCDYASWAFENTRYLYLFKNPYSPGDLKDSLQLDFKAFIKSACETRFQGLSQELDSKIIQIIRNCSVYRNHIDCVTLDQNFTTHFRELSSVIVECVKYSSTKRKEERRILGKRSKENSQQPIVIEDENSQPLNQPILIPNSIEILEESQKSLPIESYILQTNAEKSSDTEEVDFDEETEIPSKTIRLEHDFQTNNYSVEQPVSLIDKSLFIQARRKYFDQNWPAFVSVIEEALIDSVTKPKITQEVEISSEKFPIHLFSFEIDQLKTLIEKSGLKNVNIDRTSEDKFIVKIPAPFL